MTNEAYLKHKFKKSNPTKKEKECEAPREQKENAQATIDIGAS